MKSVQVSELREKLDETIEAVKNGETVSVIDGENPVAQIEPSRSLTADEWAHRIELAGVGQRGPGWGKPLPDDFFTRPRPTPKASVLEQLLEDRHSGD
jgi:antitoxin (DNA-binding transcriptional repressor) of toxin-antitoxin stability system